MGLPGPEGGAFPAADRPVRGRVGDPAGGAGEERGAGADAVAAVLRWGLVDPVRAGARGDVARKKVLNQIDKWLGESDVQRAEIDRGIKGMEEAVDNLTDSKIRARVQADRLAADIKGNKQKTAYEILRSDWSSDVCSSDLAPPAGSPIRPRTAPPGAGNAPPSSPGNPTSAEPPGHANQHL